MFSEIVKFINAAIDVKVDSKGPGNTVIGVLDIYGFEIFDNNRYIINVTHVQLIGK